MATDYYVKFIAEETIAAIAHDVRCFSSQGSGRRSLDVVRFILNDLQKFLGTTFDIDVYEPSPDDPRDAYVTYRPLTLHVVRGVWREAMRGGPMAAYILAHEIGHMILHDHFAQEFSPDGTYDLKAWPEENRAEWQADTFAAYFLVPDSTVIQIDDPYRLAVLCNVPEAIAAERRASVLASGPKFLAPTLDQCPSCNEFSLTRKGVIESCPCGHIAAV